MANTETGNTVGIENAADLHTRVDELHQRLHHHAHQYYVLDAPTLPDAEYDKLF